MVTVASAPIPDWRGRPRKVAVRTIRDWIADYEARGVEGLMRKAPANARKRRVYLSRTWDQTLRQAGASDAQMAEIVATLRQRVRSEWASGTPSWPTVQLNALPVAIAATRAAGVAKPDAALRDLCTVPRRFVEAEKRYAIVAMRDQDAARFAAKATPRIRRDRSHLRPGDWIAADVHHIDVLFRRADGTVCTPKMIAWYDLATNRVFATIVVMPKGEMVRTEHVVQSFVDMCSDPNWGAPSHLYCDNGGEYNWIELADPLAKLKHATALHVGEAPEAPPALVQKARPYNPQAKVIEGLFSTLERVAFAQLPGYIGGNRMQKKTANQGREPAPFPGDEPRLREAIGTAVAYYHAKPQAGHLAGKCPSDCFAAFVADGWHSTVLDPWELSVAFSREVIKPVHTGGTLRLNGMDFRADALQSFVGRRVLVRQPLFGDRETLFVFNEDGTPLATARPDNVYAFADPRGAGEQSRREKALRTDIKSLATSAPRLDGEGTMGDVVALRGAVAPAPTDGVIRLNPDFSEAARMAKNAPLRAEEETDRRLAKRARKSALLARMAASG